MDPFIGQIIMVGFNFAPPGWAKCEGQLLPIAQYSALYSLLGTTYGGDGRTTFGLPDLRGRCAIGAGQGPGLDNYQQGEKGGVEHVTLTHGQMPQHTHTLKASSTDGTQNSPENAIIAKNQVTIARNNTVPANAFVTGSANVNMDAQSIQATGGSQPHSNMQPFIGMNYIIALHGSFPSRP